MKPSRFFITEISCLVTAVALTTVLIWLFQVHNALHESFLIKGSGYPLTNDYKYGVLNSGRHQLLNESATTVELGYHLNRIYFDDRYIVGEVTEKRSSSERPGYATRYSFFIFDTEAPEDYKSKLTEVEFDVELKKIGIHEEVKLVDRKSKKWLKKQ